MAKLIFDSGALIAITDGDVRAIEFLRVVTDRGLLVGIAAPVLAESFTGTASEANLHRTKLVSEASVIVTDRRTATSATAL